MMLKLVVTGAHLSPEFGCTWQQIAADGFNIDDRIEIVLSSDTGVGVCKSMGLAMAGFGEAFARQAPELVVVLGDRYETLCAAAAANVLNIPVAHLHGGEVTEGAIDDAFRHAITKLSHLHFTSTQSYRERVIQLGEHPDTVFNVGAIGLDQIHGLALLDLPSLSASIGFDLSPRYLLVTYHPETIGGADPGEQADVLMASLLGIDGHKLLVTAANADVGGRAINQRVEAVVARHPGRVCMVRSLGTLRYLSAMRHARAVVGNSSSGIIEAPSLKVPTLNIGDRQRGRIRAESVIDVPLDAASIRQALRSIEDEAFRRSLCQMGNPYGDGNAAAQIAERIAQALQRPGLFRKQFHDLVATNTGIPSR